MKYLLLLMTISFSFQINAQTSLNMTLAYQWNDPTLAASIDHDNTYNEIWGYAKDGREYAIIGTTAGTHIFDITDINNVDTVYFIPGKAQGTQIIHRDYDTYRDYLYIVSDEGNSSLQIADLSMLPDSAPVVYDNNSLITTSHNIFIDTIQGNLYTCGGVTNLGPNYLSVYSLTADPTSPQFLLNCSNDVPFWNSTINYVHDIYVRNDTAYCNAGPNGIFVVDFSNMANVQGLGSITSYVQQGYNHSGWLHQSGNYYAFADETHGKDVKIVDVTNLSNITVIDTIGSNVNQNLSIAHNLIFNGDNLYVSYYFDGIYVFNTSDVNNISLAGFYETSTRINQLNVYQGNWGVYPFLPSGKILASDMQEGLFVFDVTFPVGISDNNVENELTFIVYPNPAKSSITVTTTLFENTVSYSIIDISGKIVKGGTLLKAQTTIVLDNISTGFYTFLITESNGNVVAKKFVKQ
ncbi:MAG: choice-of-anchor B family protein [Flavobacteriales bacterium]|nr:choice-of-anchor B family protein [Flavobacteriales bacterium]